MEAIPLRRPRMESVTDSKTVRRLCCRWQFGQVVVNQLLDLIKKKFFRYAIAAWIFSFDGFSIISR